MKTLPFLSLLIASAALAAPSLAAPASLAVGLEGLTPDGRLPLSSAFCAPKGATFKPQDESTGIHWSPGPEGTKSYVIIMVDPDVTTDLSLMNKPGVTIAADSPRMNIYHWVLIDIPPTVHRLAPGDDGEGFTPGGKPIGRTKFGVRGANDYWPLFNTNPHAPPGMKGPYGGFDGPCPPSNDARIHDYRYQVYALDVADLPLDGQFFAPAVLKAMQGHILAWGEAHAKFTYDGA